MHVGQNTDSRLFGIVTRGCAREEGGNAPDHRDSAMVVNMEKGYLPHIALEHHDELQTDVSLIRLLLTPEGKW